MDERQKSSRNNISYRWYLHQAENVQQFYLSFGSLDPSIGSSIDSETSFFCDSRISLTRQDIGVGNSKITAYRYVKKVMKWIEELNPRIIDIFFFGVSQRVNLSKLSMQDLLKNIFPYC